MSEENRHAAASPSPEEPAPQSALKFGTFLGVFTPSVLTILGLIMYLRLGWVVGNLGLAVTIVVVLIATSITLITALSASAIATNMQVGAGGEYYMISRSLGLELGGAIGIPLFLCRTLSITFYSFGLAESILSFWPAGWGEMPTYSGQALTAVIIIVTTLIAGKSAAVALRLQIPIMAAVGLSLLALAFGAFSGGLHAPEWKMSLRTAPEGFWYVFAVFFPAVTGFTAGIGMSGDLENPRKSIPRGTLLAVLTGAIIYVLIPILLAITARVSPEELAQPGIIWVQIAVLGVWFVYPGLWGAILSSAFGSALGGPRVLQALAADGLAPRLFSKLSKTGQPAVATWFTGAIALAAVALGGLNTVAQFVTILFLTLYVTINLSAAIERLVDNPSYRPTIAVPWYVSLLGSLGAVVVMFLISPIACFLAVLLELVLYLSLRRRALKKEWGDVRAGLWVALARFSLLRLRDHEQDPRNWRPNILVFAGDPEKRINLIRLACLFNQDRGVVTVCQLLLGDLKEQQIETGEKLQEMARVLSDAGVIAFGEVNVVSEYESGIVDVTQANGIAGLQSNTVMLGWSEKRDRLESMLRVMRAVSHAGKSTVIARINWAHEPGLEKRIDLWWGGLQNNGDLMLLFAYLLCLNPAWSDSRIVVRSVVDCEDDKASMGESLAELIPSIRIKAETEVVVRPPDKSVDEVMHQCSRGADLVFLGLREPASGEEADYAERLTELAAGFKTTIFVRNAGEFAGRLISSV